MKWCDEDQVFKHDQELERMSERPEPPYIIDPDRRIKRLFEADPADVPIVVVPPAPGSVLNFHEDAITSSDLPSIADFDIDPGDRSDRFWSR